eukprot:1384155-Alexandrium_andersonii.AAC.1
MPGRLSGLSVATAVARGAIATQAVGRMPGRCPTLVCLGQDLPAALGPPAQGTTAMLGREPWRP